MVSPPEKYAAQPWKAYVVTYFLLTTLMTGTLPSPLYGDYAALLGIPPFHISLLFSIYAVAIIACLAFFTIKILGMRANSANNLAILLCVTSNFLFALNSSYEILLIARALSGIAVGMAVTIAPTLIRANQPNHRYSSSLINLGVMFGLGTGALQTGLIAFLSPHHWITFAIHSIYFVPAAILKEPFQSGAFRNSAATTSTLSNRSKLPLTVCCVLVFSAYAFFGVFSALFGNFIHENSDLNPYLSCGISIFFIFSSAALIPLTISSPPKKYTLFFLSLLCLTSLAIIKKSLDESISLLLFFAVLLGGATSGSILKSSLVLISNVFPLESAERATSKLFLTAYTGLVVPTVAIGYFIDQLGIHTAINIYLSTLVAQTGVVAILLYWTDPEIFAQRDAVHAKR